MTTQTAPSPIETDPGPIDVDELGAAADARTGELHAARRLPADLYRAAVDAGLFRQLIEIAHAERDLLTIYRSRHPFPTYQEPKADVALAVVDREASTHIATSSSTTSTISTEDTP